MNRDQADTLARFLNLCRPEWDHPGIFKALEAAKTADPLNAALAAIRWTANPALRTPGGMGRPGEHWTERATPPTTPRPLRPDEACRNCGRTIHQPSAECDARVPVRTADVTAPVANLRALRDETAAELCSHGVPLTNCLDHMKRRETDTDPTPKETP